MQYHFSTNVHIDADFVPETDAHKTRIKKRRGIQRSEHF